MNRKKLSAKGKLGGAELLKDMIREDVNVAREAMRKGKVPGPRPLMDANGDVELFTMGRRRDAQRLFRDIMVGNKGPRSVRGVVLPEPTDEQLQGALDEVLGRRQLVARPATRQLAPVTSGGGPQTELVGTDHIEPNRYEPPDPSEYDQPYCVVIEDPAAGDDEPGTKK